MQQLLLFVEKRGGPTWDVLLGRKDSLKSSFSGANQFIPAPNSSLEILIDNFKQHGLEIEDLVALSGIFVTFHIIIELFQCTRKENKKSMKQLIT